MVRSMTGFARATTSTDTGEFSCEIRAVNHRYLDTQLRLPEELRAIELDLKNALAAQISRGKVECGFFIKRSSASAGPQRINPEAVAALKASIQQLKQGLGETAKANPLEILRWPGILEEAPVAESELAGRAASLLEETLESFNGMRSREGARLAAMLLERVDGIERIAGEVRVRMPTVLDAMRTRITDRVQSLDSDADPARLATEVAILAQKLDVDEELDRLGSHLTEIRNIIQRDEPVGRRLDFLMQELNREANTLASKSADSETTKAAVDLKVLIEQMREQIQNIE